MNKFVHFLSNHPSLVYTLLFLGIFIQYPLSGSLPGHSDTLLNLSIFNDTLNRISAFIHHEAIGRAYYPELYYEAFTELYWGHILIFIPFKLIHLSDIWAYYFFISIIYILNAYAAFYFFKYFNFSKESSLLGGLLFSANAFAFSQIEFLNGIPYFFFFSALIMYFKYIQSKLFKYLAFSSILIAVEFYFSIYITIYFVVICSSIFIVHFFQKKGILISIQDLIKAIIIGLILISPYIYIMIKYGFLTGGYSIIDVNNIEKFSLHLTDLIRPLPNHQFYKDWFPQNDNDSFRMVNYGFLGISFILFSILGLKKINKDFKPIFYIFLFSGIILSVGPYFYNGNFRIPAPLYPLYKNLGFSGALRIPGRAYSLIIIAAIFSILSFLDKMDTKGIKNITIILFAIVFYFENIPHRFVHNEYEKQLTMPTFPKVYLDNLPNDEVILTLPSSLFTGKKFRKDGLSEHSREELYLLWQTQHKKNTVNGIGSYMSFHRKDVDSLIHANKWDALYLNYQISKIVYFKDYVIDNTDINQLENLKKSTLFKEIKSTDKIIIFEAKQK